MALRRRTKALIDDCNRTDSTPPEDKLSDGKQRCVAAIRDFVTYPGTCFWRQCLKPRQPGSPVCDTHEEEGYQIYQPGMNGWPQIDPKKTIKPNDISEVNALIRHEYQRLFQDRRSVIVDLLSKIQDYEAQGKQLSTGASELQKQLAATRQKIADLEKQLQAALDEKKNLKVDLDTMDKEKKQAEANARNLQSELTRVTGELDKANQALANAERLKRDADARIAELQRQISELEQKTQTADASSKAMIADLERKLAGKELELKNAKQQRDNMQKTRDAAINQASELEGEVNRLKNDLQLATAEAKEVGRLRQALADEKSKNAEEVAKLTAEIGDLKITIADKDKELQANQQRIKDLDAEIAKQRAQIATLNAERDKWKSDYTNLQEDMLANLEAEARADTESEEEPGEGIKHSQPTASKAEGKLPVPEKKVYEKWLEVTRRNAALLHDGQQVQSWTQVARQTVGALHAVKGREFTRLYTQIYKEFQAYLIGKNGQKDMSRSGWNFPNVEKANAGDLYEHLFRSTPKSPLKLEQKVTHFEHFLARKIDSL